MITWISEETRKAMEQHAQDYKDGKLCQHCLKNEKHPGAVWCRQCIALLAEERHLAARVQEALAEEAAPKEDGYEHP